MPLYEYKCRKCGDVFELIQKFSDLPLTVHNNGCGGPVERLVGAPALHFKGSGWYITDYAKGKNDSSKAGKNGQATASASSESESTKESKKTDTPAAPKNGATANAGKK